MEQTINMESFTKLNSPFISESQTLTNAFFGLDPNASGLALEDDDDYETHVFFTRPQLRLTEDNCILTSELNKLLTDKLNTVHSYSRAILDPRLFYNSQKFNPDIVDNYNPFIPILSNTLKKVSGWPDPVLDTRTSSEGRVKQQTIIADGTVDIYKAYDLDLTFRNVPTMPVTSLFMTWMDYMDKVHKGRIQPYLDMILRREVDYMTRVYVILTDRKSNNIKMFANTGAGFPYVINIAGLFDYNSEAPTRVSEVSVRLKCIGAEYNKIVAMIDFNMLMGAFNPMIRKLQNGEDHGLYEVPKELYTRFKSRMYPYIDVDAGKLLWYIPKDYIKIKEKEDDGNKDTAI
jgi:hypothetical protein